MNKLKMLLTAFALAVSAGGANAAVYYADKIIDAHRGACATSAKRCAENDRLNKNNALGVADGSFYSLGLGGNLTLGFGRELFTDVQEIKAFEITFGSITRTNHFEAVNIYTVLGNTATLIGTITNLGGGGLVRSLLPFEHIRLVDVTRTVFPGSSSLDGFDVDSIKIAPIPLPATGLLLLAGLGGMTALRRRKQSAA